MAELPVALVEPFAPLLIAVATALLSRLLPFSARLHPYSLLRMLAERMQRKVVRPGLRSPSQQRAAGLLSALLLLLPLLLPLYLLLSWAYQPLLVEAVLLWLLLSGEQSARELGPIATDLAQDFKLKARQRLQPLVLRQTDNLSALGLIKATIETRLLRSCALLFSPLFWYLLAGIEVSLTLLLLRQLCMVWNRKLSRYYYFAAIPATLLQWFEWLPCRLFALLLSAHRGLRYWLRHAWRGLAPFPDNNSGLVLGCAAQALRCNLAGPRFYAGQKIRLVRLDAGTDVIEQTLRHCQQLLRWLYLHALLLASGYSLLMALPSLLIRTP